MITVGVPVLGPASWSFVESLVGLKMPDGETLRFIRIGPKPVDVARNAIVSAFLATPDRWLLMIDADATLHPETLLRLLSWRRPVVGALAFGRHAPHPPVVMRDRIRLADGREGLGVQLQEMREWLGAHNELLCSGPALLDRAPADSLTQVTATGCHCLLVHRDVLERMDQPWFETDPGQAFGEDLFFCRRLEQLHVPIYVDRSCMTGHLVGDQSVAALDWLVWDQVSDYAQQHLAAEELT